MRELKVVGCITCIAESVADMMDEATRITQGRKMDRSFSLVTVGNVILKKTKIVFFDETVLMLLNVFSTMKSISAWRVQVFLFLLCLSCFIS